MSVTKLRLGSIYTGVPGVYSEINRDNMVGLSPVAEGVVALVGEAEGGGEGGGAKIVEVSSPASLKRLLRSGALLEAGLIAFSPSDDDAVGGAVKLLLVKVNPAVQGSVILSNADGQCLQLTAVDYGQFTNRINVEKDENGALPGSNVDFTVSFEEDSELFEAIGEDGWFSLQYDGDYDTAELLVGTDANGNPDEVYVQGSRSFTGESVAAGLSWSGAATIESTSGVGSVVTVHGVDSGGVYRTEQVTLIAGGPGATGTTTTTWQAVTGIEIDILNGDPVDVKDAGGTTYLTLPSGQSSVGIVTCQNMPVAGVTIEFSGISGSAVVVVHGKDEAGADATAIYDAAGGITAKWTEITSVEVGYVLNTDTVELGPSGSRVRLWQARVDDGVTTIRQMYDSAANVSAFTVELLDNAPDTDLISELDIPTAATYGTAQPLDVKSTTKTLYAKLTELIRAINDGSAYVTASRVDGATGVPSDTAAPIYLSGGSEGTTTTSHWLQALETLKTTEEPQTIVVLTEDATIHAALDAHLDERARGLRREADGKVGLPSGKTKSEIKALVRAINSRHIQVCAQEIQRVDSTGVTRWFAPMYQAVLLAGMQAGASAGTPMTHKYADVLDVRQDSSWNPVDDAEDMLDYGLTFLEYKANKGYRWVRSITSYLSDTNLSNIEASTNHAVNVFIRNFREVLEAKVGDVNFAGTLQALRSLAIQALDEALATGRIVEWRNLTLTASGDEVSVSVEVAPAVPTNFVAVTANLYLYEGVA